MNSCFEFFVTSFRNNFHRKYLNMITVVVILVSDSICDLRASAFDCQKFVSKWRKDLLNKFDNGCGVF